MRLSSIFFVAAITLVASCNTVSAATQSEQTKLSTAAIPDAVQSADIALKKSARSLRSHKTEEEDEERTYPFLVSEGTAREVAKRTTDQLDDALLTKIGEIKNGKQILNRWRTEGHTLAELKPLLREADRWTGTSERKVYKLLKANGFS